MTYRKASHAGSWYTAHGPSLSKQLEAWLNQVDHDIARVGPVPRPGARVIIAPYEGRWTIRGCFKLTDIA